MTDKTCKQKSLEQKVVMHIEDDSMLRDIVRDFLEMSGLNVVSVESLAEFYKWHEQNQSADFYISDGNLEHEDAWEDVARYLTELSQKNANRIRGMIVVSGTLKEPERYRQYPIIKGTIWKPLDFFKMTELVNKCLAGDYREEFFNVQ